MNLDERIKLAMKSRKPAITQKGLAAAVGVNQSIISTLVTGKAEGSTHIVQIANELHVSPLWLATGEGPMNHSPSEQELFKITSNLPEAQVRALLEIVKNFSVG